MKISVGIMPLICPVVAFQFKWDAPSESFRDYFGNEFNADTLGARISEVTDGTFIAEEMAKLRNVDPKPGEDDPSASAYVNGRVSIVTPTLSSREDFQESLWRCFKQQTYPDKELVVFETYTRNSRPSPFFTKKASVEPHILYVPMLWKRNKELHVGVKRDVTLFLASGEFIVQFDDSDLYAPGYVSKVVNMFHGNAVAVTMTGWYNYNAEASGATYSGCYTDTTKCPFAKYGADFTYAYRREIAIQHPFPNIPSSEDVAFMMRMRYAGKVALWNDTSGLAVHVVHSSDSAQTCCTRQVPTPKLNKLPALKHRQSVGLRL